MDPYRYLTGTVVPVPDPDGLSEVPTMHLPWCFGCGPENDDGLGLRPRFVGDRVEADIRFAPRFQGGPGLVHGGAISAFFDDLIGFVMMAHQKPGVTAKLETNYLQPIPLGITLHGTAWLSEQDGRKMWAEAVGEDDHGKRYIEARALFLPITADHFADTMQFMDPEQAAKLSRYERDEYYP
ncbi:MAG: PaaI family thioesterase [Acidimicrobiia bacterium]|nr:PaaI family thioesterase [Acidimicrobiia bacterium]